MDFLTNLKNVAKDTASTVAKKSGELVEVSKIKYQIFDLSNDVKKLYSEIGRLTYLAIEKEEDHNDAIKMKCDIAAAKLAKIAALKSGNVKKGMTCPECGRKSDCDDSFCPSCGADMVVDADIEVME